MRFLRNIVALVIAFSLLSAAVMVRAQNAGSDAAAATAISPYPVRYFFPQLEKHPSTLLRANDAQMAITFGVPIDQHVSKAMVRVSYTYSPMMIPLQSHIKVLLNDEVVGVITMTADNAGRPMSNDIAIDPILIKDFNRLSLELVGHYTDACEDPMHQSLWVDIHTPTEVQLTVQPFGVPSDLSMLPKPFFDPQILTTLNLPFVFSAKPSYATLRAAGMSASWFGKLASWRGARFNAVFDTVPKGHAIVFATNTERPAFLANREAYTGPGLEIINNPADGYSRLLLITGRNSDDLITASRALVLGNTAMSGEHVSIVTARDAAPRKAYDAPNWVRLDRPVKFGELVDSPQQLQVRGHTPEPVFINLRIPPDLFTWRSRGVPVDLKFRYTPTVRTSDSHLVMSINNEQVQTMNLRASGQGGESSHMVLPLLDTALLGDTEDLLIPAFKLGTRNQLEYTFTFGAYNSGPCITASTENMIAMIDPDSKIDFSAYPHYAEMPHLGYFATAGFPFTKYADLSQTLIVMPEHIVAQDVTVMLTLLGRMGESTGYPATLVDVVGPNEEGKFANRDLLVIGTVSAQALLARWSTKLPAVIAGSHQHILKPEDMYDVIFDLLGFSNEQPAESKAQQHVRGNGPLAAMLAFQSPVSSRRSVVAVTGIDPDDMVGMLDRLRDDSVTKTMYGSVILFYGGIVESIFAGHNYWIGSLPLWTSLWYHLSGHPVVLAIMSVIAVLIFAFALWRMLKRIAKRRL